MKHKRADGTSARPSLVLIDDPQTDESARSPSQCANRERILAGAILGLAGPGKKIAGLMTLTVVRPDDLADRILDREKHPQWQGERTKMVYAFPVRESLWQRYAELRAEGLRNDRGLADATAFYGQHRSAMDEGAQVAWRATVATLKEASVDFEMVWDTADAGFTAIKNAFFNNAPIGLQILDETSGQGLQADFSITNFSRNEALEEAITVSVTAKVTYSATAPSWIGG
jgi:hypothetical protein